jgi:hypothetical protein
MWTQASLSSKVAVKGGESSKSSGEAVAGRQSATNWPQGRALTAADQPVPSAAVRETPSVSQVRQAQPGTHSIRTQWWVDVSAEGAHLDRARKSARSMTLALAGYLLSLRASSTAVSQTQVGVASWGQSGSRWQRSHSPSLITSRRLRPALCRRLCGHRRRPTNAQADRPTEAGAYERFDIVSVHLQACGDNAMVGRPALRLVEHLHMLTIEVAELAAEITERVTVVAPSYWPLSAAPADRGQDGRRDRSGAAVPLQGRRRPTERHRAAPVVAIEQPTTSPIPYRKSATQRRTASHRDDTGTDTPTRS